MFILPLLLTTLLTAPLSLPCLPRISLFIIPFFNTFFYKRRGWLSPSLISTKSLTIDLFIESYFLLLYIWCSRFYYCIYDAHATRLNTPVKIVAKSVPARSLNKYNVAYNQFAYIKFTFANIKNNYFTGNTSHSNLKPDQINHSENLTNIIGNFKNHEGIQRIKLANFHHRQTFNFRYVNVKKLKRN